MPRKIEFIQRRFTRPNQEIFQEDGDFDHSYHFMRNTAGTGLRRAPAWSAHKPFPSGFTACRGMFYDADAQRLVFIGTKNAHLATCYLTFYSDTMSEAATEIDTGTATISGAFGCNFLFWRDYLYYIRSSRQVYKSANYNTTATVMHANQDGQAITVVGERPMMATTSGELYMLNRSNVFMKMWYVATGFTVRYMLPMDGQLMMFCQRDDGGTQIVRMPTDPAYSKYIYDAITEDASLVDTVIPDPAHIVTIPGTGDHSTYGCLYVEHQGDIFFSAGRAKTKTFIYRFNGSRVELADEIPYTIPSAQCDGLVTWQDQLFFHSIDTGINYLRVWMGEGFTFLTNKTFTLGSSLNTCVATPGPTLAVADNPGGVEGIYYLTTNINPDATLVTCHLDLGHPGRLKRLNRVVITFNDCDSTTATCRTRYTKNQATSLGTLKAAAVCSSPHIIEPSTHIDFYTLQLELTFADPISTDQPTWVPDLVPVSIAILATLED